MDQRITKIGCYTLLYGLMLLLKVEELTLHLIEQDKINKEQTKDYGIEEADSKLIYEVPDVISRSRVKPGNLLTTYASKR